MLTKQLHKQKFLLFTQNREEYPNPVVIKTLANRQAPTPLIEQLHNEYRITQQLSGVSGVRSVLAKEGSAHQPTLLLEYIEGLTLREAIQDGSLDLREKLRLATDLAHTIDLVHAQNVVHQAISSNNILLAEDGSVYLIDFGLATLEKQPELNWQGENLTQTDSLAFISPEQTGRINRQIDYRTDFYSLGVALYELFTGQLPFQGEMTLDVIHSHIAKKPSPPHEIDPDFPLPLSLIILKLLNKNAEDRYQTAHSLQADLRHCWKSYDAKGTIPPFELGVNDITGFLQFPEKLYGRDRELIQLLSAFEVAASGEQQICFVAGYSGVGKTTLIRELKSAVAGRQGLFIEGKFEQFAQDMPYQAWSQAFSELVNIWMTGDANFIQAKKEAILTAVGQNGQILVDLIPNLEELLGPQPDAPVLGNIEAQNRFHYLWQQFIQIATSPEQPLLIFLDDLQWIDLASLRLLESLLDHSENRHLIFVGAYRDNEVDVKHPLQVTLERDAEATEKTTNLIIDNLTLDDVALMLADTLSLPVAQCQPLAQLLHSKTDGNVFFLRQMLVALVDDGTIFFEEGKRSWQWDDSELQRSDVSKNIVDYLLGKMQQLPAPCLELLEIAACLGNQSNLHHLHLISEHTPPFVEQQLQPAVDQRYIDLIQTTVRFGHDRIQQAAYTFIPDSEKLALHRRIGQILLEHTNGKLPAEQIFEIVGHLEKGSVLGLTAVERMELAQLNLQAAETAKQTVAYGKGVAYVQRAVQLLGGDGWQDHYQMMLHLHLLGAEIAYLNTEHELSETFIKKVMTAAESDLDRAAASAIQIESYSSQNKLKQAMVVGLESVQALGMTLHEAPPANLSIELLQELPPMTDPRGLASIKILDACVIPAFQVDPDNFPAIIFSALHVMEAHGLTPSSCYALSIFGMFVWAEDVVAADAFGNLAENLAERVENRGYLCRVRSVLNGFILPWQISYWEIAEKERENLQFGLQSGDYIFAANEVENMAFREVFTGGQLTLFPELYERNVQMLEEIEQQWTMQRFRLLRQYVNNLQCPTDDPLKFLGPFFAADEDLPKDDHENEAMLMFTHYGLQTLLHYQLGHYESAYELVGLAKHFSAPLLSFLPVFIVPYLQSLAYWQLPSERRTEPDIIEQNLATLTNWAVNVPMNFQHKLDLVLAEQARVAGDVGTAIVHYEQAIKGAKENDFLQDEAWANEHYGRFWLQRGNEQIAQLYLREAHALYHRWGAHTIVAHLGKLYPHWLAPHPSDQPSDDESHADGADIDLQSIMKTAETITGEIELEKLLQELIEIVLRNSGGQRAYLIIKRGQQWFIEAEGDVTTDKLQVLQSASIAEHDIVPVNIVNYVARSKQPVLLDNAAVAGQFVHDAIIQSRQVKSVLCFPLINQTDVNGILYLENNLTKHVFSPERVSLLKMLSSLMAVAIDNAYLYKNLENEVTKRTTALSYAEEQIRSLFANSQMGIGLTTAEGKILAANDALQQMLGYTEEELLRHSVVEFYDNPEARGDLLRQLAEAEQVKNFSLKVKHKNGSSFDANLNISKVYREGQQVFLTLIEDVTEAMQLQEQLHFQAKMLEVVEQAIVVTNIEGEVIYWNPFAEKLYGWSAAEVLGKKTNEFFIDDYTQAPFPEINDALFSGKSWTGEFEVNRKDGTRLPIQSILTSTYDEAGQRVFTIGIGFDITERKRWEETLKTSRLLLQSTLDALPTNIAVLDKQGVIVSVNKAWREFADANGLAWDDYGVGRRYLSVSNLTPDAETEDLQQVTNGIEALLTDKLTEFHFEYPCHSPTEERWFFMRAVRFENDKRDLVVVSHDNITEQKQLGVALQESHIKLAARYEKQHRRLMENESHLAGIMRMAADAIISIDEAQKIVQFNEAAERMFGYTAVEVIGEPLNLLLPQQSKSIHGSHIETHARSRVDSRKMAERQDISGRRKNGDLFPADATISKLAFADRVIMTAIVRDMSERNMMLQALQDNQARLLKAQRVGRIGSWEWDIVADKVLWSDELFHIFGLEPGELIPTSEGFLQHVHPDDRQNISSQIEATLSIDHPFIVEHRTVTKDGRIKFIHGEAELERDDQGQPLRLSGIAQDITRRRQTIFMRELSIRLMISQIISSTTEFEAMLNLVLNDMQQFLNFSNASILAIEGNMMVFQAIHRPNPQSNLVGSIFPYQEIPLFAEMSSSHKTKIIADEQEFTQNRKAFQRLTGNSLDGLFAAPNIFVAVPLIQNDRLVGVFSLIYDQHNFSGYEQETELLEQVAEQLAVTLDNVQKMQVVQETAVSEERNRLAHELHDSVTQTLFSASIIAEVLPTVWEKSPEQGQVGLEELRALTQGALAEMRTLLLELRPATLTEKSLAALLDELATAVTSRSKIPIALNIIHGEKLEPEQQIALYRIVQESLFNVTKHAEAHKITMIVDAKVDRGKIKIVDDGRGFSPDSIQPTSLGLTIMKERAQKSGIQLIIDSQLNQGTTITAVWGDKNK